MKVRWLCCCCCCWSETQNHTDAQMSVLWCHCVALQPPPNLDDIYSDRLWRRTQFWSEKNTDRDSQMNWASSETSEFSCGATVWFSRGNHTAYCFLFETHPSGRLRVTAYPGLNIRFKTWIYTDLIYLWVLFTCLLLLLLSDHLRASLLILYVAAKLPTAVKLSLVVQKYAVTIKNL